MTVEYDLLLDATEHDCPMPTIQAKEALDSLTSGQVLKLLTSKEGTVRNIRTLVANNDFELLNESADGVNIAFFIKKM